MSEYEVFEKTSYDKAIQIVGRFLTAAPDHGMHIKGLPECDGLRPSFGEEYKGMTGLLAISMESHQGNKYSINLWFDDEKDEVIISTSSGYLQRHGNGCAKAPRTVPQSYEVSHKAEEVTTDSVHDYLSALIRGEQQQKLSHASRVQQSKSEARDTGNRVAS